MKVIFKFGRLTVIAFCSWLGFGFNDLGFAYRYDFGFLKLLLEKGQK